MKLINVVEDHQVIREGVRRYLELAGYKVIGFGNMPLCAMRSRSPRLIF